MIRIIAPIICCILLFKVARYSSSISSTILFIPKERIIVFRASCFIFFNFRGSLIYSEIRFTRRISVATGTSIPFSSSFISSHTPPAFMQKAPACIPYSWLPVSLSGGLQIRSTSYICPLLLDRVLLQFAFLQNAGKKQCLILLLFWVYFSLITPSPTMIKYK